MTYKIVFLMDAQKDWDKLDNSIKKQFANIIENKIKHNPKIIKNRLRGLEDCYKIKLKSSGYRLVYQVLDKIITVSVIAVGRRDKDIAYDSAEVRLSTE
jgi:mRNA interferase RelE/StbE